MITGLLKTKCHKTLKTTLQNQWSSYCRVPESSVCTNKKRFYDKLSFLINEFFTICHFGAFIAYYVVNWTVFLIVEGCTVIYNAYFNIILYLAEICLTGNHNTSYFYKAFTLTFILLKAEFTKYTIWKWNTHEKASPIHFFFSQELPIFLQTIEHTIHDLKDLL